MKYKIIYIAAATAAMTVSCGKQDVFIPNDSEQPAGTVRTERIGLVLADNPNTKVNVDGTTGAITWIQNTDQIAVCIKTNSTYAYRTCSVNGDSAIEVDLANNQTRVQYAVYPADAAITNYYGNSNPLRINYRQTYNLTSLTTLEEVSNYCPAPMVAINDGEVLNFYHVGSVLRLTLPNVPQGTTFIRIYFEGLNTSVYSVNGQYTITNGGTPSCTATIASGANRYLDFSLASTLFSDAKHDLVLNIPLPPGNCSSITKVSASYHKTNDSAAASYSNGFSTYSLAESPWAQSERAVGRKVLLPSPFIGTFGGKLISGFHTINTVPIDYASRDDLSPFKDARSNIEYGYPRAGYYSIPSAASSAGYSQASASNSNYVSSVWGTVLGATRGGSIVGGVEGCRYAYVIVTGMDNNTYSRTSIGGWLFFPDGCELSAISGISVFNGASASAGSITQTTLNQLVQNPPYCFFMPFCGSYRKSGSTWTSSGVGTNARIPVRSSQGGVYPITLSGFNSISYGTSYDIYSEYSPLRLYKDIYPKTN